MPVIQRSAIVPYSPEQMFNLVNDIAAYPEFLPWCHSSEIESQTETQIIASLEIAKGAIRKRFTTCNTLSEKQRIEMTLLKGPFKSLHGLWLFETIGDNGCQVSFSLEFELSNKLLSMTLGPWFSHVTNQLVDAFTERARVVYK